MQSALLLLLGSAVPIFSQSLVHGPAPAPSTLSTTQSGVLPVAPTPFPSAGLQTEEGAITYDGPMNPGFVGPGGYAVIQSNTAGAAYQAILPNSNFDDATGTTITGSIMALVPTNGTGVMFTVNFTGFPSEAEYGPFVYHIHGLPVPADGNCTATMGHLDPTDRGEYYPCDNTQPASCQAGDLAGKHGNITGTSFTGSFLDLYLSATPGSPYYFGDKSIVIHSMNTTRLTCANFAMMASNSSATGTGTSMPSPTTSPIQITGAAGRVSITTGLLGYLAVFAPFLL